MNPALGTAPGSDSPEPVSGAPCRRPDGRRHLRAVAGRPGAGRVSGACGGRRDGLAAVPTAVTQRFDDGSGTRRRIGPVPTTVSPAAPFTLIDAWPSFERNPVDNVWRGESD